MTLLTAIQAAAPLLSLQQPAQLFGSTQETQVLLRTLANRELLDLLDRHEWPQLLAEHTFTTVAAELQPTGFPSDYNRMVPDTFWNRDSDWRVFGPLTPQEWSYHKTQGLSSSVVHMWMRRGTGLHIYPEPPAGQTMAYEYVRTNAVEDTGGTPKAQFTADTDVPLLPEELITLGVVWRFLQQKGLDYAEALKTYELRLQKEVGRARGARKLSMVPGQSMSNRDIVPEGDWTL